VMQCGAACSRLGPQSNNLQHRGIQPIASHSTFCLHIHTEHRMPFPGRYQAGSHLSPLKDGPEARFNVEPRQGGHRFGKIGELTPLGCCTWRLNAVQFAIWLATQFLPSPGKISRSSHLPMRLRMISSAILERVRISYLKVQRPPFLLFPSNFTVS